LESFIRSFREQLHIDRQAAFRDAGVNPNAGGEFGLFLLSLTQAWPHNDKKTNATWRSLVISHGANLDWISPISHKSARQIIAEKGLLPNYPDFVE
jgi:hypothetical protein